LDLNDSQIPIQAEREKQEIHGNATKGSSMTALARSGREETKGRGATFPLWLLSDPRTAQGKSKSWHGIEWRRSLCR